MKGGHILAAAVLAFLGEEVDELALVERVVVADDLGEFSLLDVGGVGLAGEEVGEQALLAVALQVLLHVTTFVPTSAVVLLQVALPAGNYPAPSLLVQHRLQMPKQAGGRLHVEHSPFRGLTHPLNHRQSLLLQDHSGVSLL